MDYENFEYMCASHIHSSFNSIELYITLQQTLPSQQSRIIDQAEFDEYEVEDSDEAEVEVDVIDEEEEEEIETLVDHLLNNNTEDDDHQAPLPSSHVYCPP